jgi:electron transport complex protein RnfC
MGVPGKVIIPMVQHIGAPCTPLVQKGDRVTVGRKIGNSDAAISAPIHSSVSGTVTAVRPILYAGGFEVESIEIESDGLQETCPDVKPPDGRDRSALIRAIRESGLVGLGGAGFPTAVKLTPPMGKTLDVLVLNGAECESYITSDFREMIENADGVIEGARIIMELTGIRKAHIAIEANKPEAISLMNRKVAGDSSIDVIELRTLYPQGGEKQLIYAATGRKVPAGGLPADIGVLVQNVATASFIAGFVKTGMPLIKKKVTVDGSAVASPRNVEVLIGTSLGDVFEFCGGFRETPAKIIMGGPMMGVAQFSLDNSVIKHTNGLLAFGTPEAEHPSESVCIKCGRCVAACPMNLLPLYLNACTERKLFERLNDFHVLDCIECGCCSYVCPSARRLVQSIRYGKGELRKMAREEK